MNTLTEEIKKQIDQEHKKAQKLGKEMDIVIDKFTAKYPETKEDLSQLLSNIWDIEVKIDHCRSQIHNLLKKENQNNA